VSGALVPPDIERTLLEALPILPEFSIFWTLLQASGLQSVLDSTGPQTVFVPMNAALDGFNDSTVVNAISPASLQDYILCHITNANYNVKSFILVDAGVVIDNTTVQFITLLGQTLIATVNENGEADINIGEHYARVLMPDVFGSNGMLQGLNGSLCDLPT